MASEETSVKSDTNHRDGKLAKFPQKLKESLNTILKNEGFSEYNISKKCVTDPGLSFQADLFIVSIEGIVNKDPKEINLFIKYQIPNSIITAQLPDVMYSNEIEAHSKLLVIFKELEKEANVPIDERFNVVKYYESSNPRAVIMDNLTLKGYFVYNRWKIITLEYAEMVLKELAKFHSMSFLLEKMDHDVYINVIKNTKTPYVFNEDYKKYFKNVFDNIIGALECDSAKKKVSKFAETAFAELINALKASKLQTNVLCHGDYRVNNILIKEENGVLSEVVILDYQCTFFLISATDKEFRKKHWNHLKNFYYDSLENYLKYFGIKASNVYARQEYEDDFKRNLHYAIMAAGHLLPIILLPESKTIAVHSAKVSEINLTNTDEYKERMREVVEDCIDWGCI